MKCPHCGSEKSTVEDTRRHTDGESIRRRRECCSCGKRFTTLETACSRPDLRMKKRR